MTIELSDKLIESAAIAAKKLLEKGVKNVSLPKPWLGFYVSFSAPADDKKIFKVFPAAELGLEQKGRQVFLVCSNFFGN